MLEVGTSNPGKPTVTPFGIPVSETVDTWGEKAVTKIHFPSLPPAEAGGLSEEEYPRALVWPRCTR